MQQTFRKLNFASSLTGANVIVGPARNLQRFRLRLVAVILQVTLFLFPGLAIGGVVPVVQPAFHSALAEQTLKDVTKRVDSHYNRLHSLSVHFTETYQGMGMKRSEKGILLLEKPGRMRWNYTDPAGKLFVIDGKYGYSYTPGDAQAQRYPAKQLEGFRSPLRFLLGHTRIEKELTNLTLTPDGTGYRLIGVPKGMEQRVAEVELTVTPDGAITAIQWKETDGAITSFLLTEERANPPLSADTFSFHPPAGVVVVHGLAPI